MRELASLGLLVDRQEDAGNRRLDPPPRPSASCGWAVLRRSPPAERDAAVRRIGDTARTVLARAREEGRTPLEVAETLVDERLAAT